MRKLLVGILLAMAVVLVPALTLAQGVAERYGLDATREATGGLLPKTVAGASTLPELVGAIVAVALSLLGIVFFILIFYSGIRWMTARGNTDMVTEAKGTMEAAVIGLIIVLASYAAARFVLERLVDDGPASAPTADTRGPIADADSSACQQAGGTCVVNDGSIRGNEILDVVCANKNKNSKTVFACVMTSSVNPCKVLKNGSCINISKTTCTGELTVDACWPSETKCCVPKK